MSLDLMTEIAYRLTVGEVICKCGCQSHHMHVDFLKAWEKLRKTHNKPILGVSWVRCREYNKKIGGEINSGHIAGMAFDPAKSTFDLNDPENLFLAMNCGFIGFGRSHDASNRQHLDTKPRSSIKFWQYTSTGMIEDQEAFEFYEKWGKEGKII